MIERQGKALIGTGSPWGLIDFATLLADGITAVETPSHGGVKVSRELNEQIPSIARDPDGWYEEDCEFAIPFIVFRDILAKSGDKYTLKGIEYAPKSLLRWFPQYAEALGVKENII